MDFEHAEIVTEAKDIDKEPGAAEQNRTALP